MIDLPTCVCGRIMDGVQTQCWPCESGNIRAGFYCPPDARGPIYGASLAGHSPVPGAALRAVEAVWITPATDPCTKCAALAQQIVTLSSQCADLEDQAATAALPCHDCAAMADASEALQARVDDLLAQNDDLAIENLAFANQIVRLKGHAEELAAQVRAGKGGAA